MRQKTGTSRRAPGPPILARTAVQSSSRSRRSRSQSVLVALAAVGSQPSSSRRFVPPVACAVAETRLPEFIASKLDAETPLGKASANARKGTAAGSPRRYVVQDPGGLVLTWDLQLEEVEQMKLIAQPNKTVRLGEWLSANLDDPQWTALEIAVAFASTRGTAHIAEKLSRFATRASVLVVVGVDRFGTSYEALELLLGALRDRGEVRVFHDEGSHLFHPKFYIFSNEQRSLVALGSHNLTEGGLYTNYEVALEVSLELNSQDDAAVLDELRALLRAYCDPDSGSSRRLSDEELESLGREKYVLRDAEAVAARQPSPLRRTPRFGSQRVPPPPRLRSRASTQEASRAQESTELPRGFVMTLQNTDVGRGQVQPHTSQRSPEIFLPVVAVRDQEPAFWGWPDSFAPDPSQPQRSTRPVVIRLAGERVEAKIWRNPPPPIGKNDFRLRSESIRSAGSIDDILKVEIAPATSGYDYYVEIVPLGRSDYDRYALLCTESTQRENSRKRWGYYA